jgi:hypothetical protein
MEAWYWPAWWQSRHGHRAIAWSYVGVRAGLAVLQSRGDLCDPLGHLSQEARMKEVRKVHYVKGVFVCPSCRQSYVQEKWIEAWRVRCHRCEYRGALTDVSVEERMEEETFRR